VYVGLFGHYDIEKVDDMEDWKIEDPMKVTLLNGR